MPRPELFVSYARGSHASHDLLAILEPAIREAGGVPRRDVDITFGAEWEPTLLAWLRSCHGAVVLLSPEALVSEWCAREIQHLLMRRVDDPDAFTILPILLDGLSWSEVSATPPFAELGRIQGLVGVEAIVDRVVAAVRELVDAVALPEAMTRGVAPAPPRTPAGLLVAAQQVVPFVGRRAVLEHLGEWLDEARSVSVQLIHGPGGVGKTRLALELVEQRNASGWDAGVLDRDVTTDALSRLGESSVGASLFVVVDYAETRTDTVRRLLRACLSTQGRTRSRPRVRVLLLARSSGEWWTTLAHQDASFPDLLAGSPDPLLLEALDTPADREALWERAWDHLARHPLLGLAEIPARPDCPEAVGNEPALSRPLYLTMAALVQLAGSSLRQTSPSVLFDRMLWHESRYWQLALVEEHGGPVPANAATGLRPLIAALVLLGGSSVEALDRVLAHAWATPDPELQVRAIRRLYGDSQTTTFSGFVRPLEPDVLGEHAVGAWLAERPGWLVGFFEDLNRPIPQPLTVLTRLAARTGEVEWLHEALRGRLVAWWSVAVHVARETGGPLPLALEACLRSSDVPQSAEELERMYDELPGPRRTVALAPLALTVTLLRLERCDSGDLRQLGQWQGNLALRLADLGRHEEAVAAAERAAQLFRSLVATRPDEFRRPLAQSLSNLATQRSALGRRNEALAAIEEAVALFRDCAETRPEDLRDLAGGLTNLGTSQWDVGRLEEGLATTMEALRLKRLLTNDATDESQSDLAAGLHNLGIMLTEIGRPEDAIEALAEAIEIRRDLAQKWPDAFLPELADDLDSQGGNLSALGRHHDAIAVSEEANRLLRSLVKARPDTFLPRLAGNLLRLGPRYLGGLRNADALAASQEAVSLFRQLVQDQPDAFLPDLATGLNNLGACLASLGRLDAGIRAFGESEELWRRLADSQPETFLPDLAECLRRFGLLLLELGRLDDAQQVTAEAVEILRRLAMKTSHRRLRVPLVLGLCTLGRVQAALGDVSTASSATREAAEHARRVARKAPEAHLREIIGSLLDLGEELLARGLPEAVLVSSEASRYVFRRIPDVPIALLPGVASSLDRLAVVRTDLGQPSEALDASMEAVALRRRVQLTDPEPALPALPLSLFVQARTLVALDRRDEAVAAYSESLIGLLPFLRSEPEVFDEPARQIWEDLVRVHPSPLPPEIHVVGRELIALGVLDPPTQDV